MTGRGAIALAVACHMLLTVLPARAAESSFDRVWNRAILYENRENTFLQKIALSGRLQGEWARFETDEGEFEDTLWRRFRFGFRA